MGQQSRHPRTARIETTWHSVTRNSLLVKKKLRVKKKSEVCTHLVLLAEEKFAPFLWENHQPHAHPVRIQPAAAAVLGLVLPSFVCPPYTNTRTLPHTVVVPTARPPPHPGLVTANHTFPTPNVTGHVSAVQNSQDPGLLAHPQHPLCNTKYIRCLAKQIRRRRRGPGTPISRILVTYFVFIIFLVSTTIKILSNYYYLL